MGAVIFAGIVTFIGVVVSIFGVVLGKVIGAGKNLFDAIAKDRSSKGR